MGALSDIRFLRQQRLNTPFAALPWRSNDPALSTWGMWGSEDEVGTLNLINEHAIKLALQEVTLGSTVPLK